MTQQERDNFVVQFEGLNENRQILCYRVLDNSGVLADTLSLLGFDVRPEDLPEVVEILRNQNIGAGGGRIAYGQPQTPYEKYLEKEEEKHGTLSRERLEQDIDALTELTNTKNSGLIVGRVQSGKTASYIGLIAALQDRNWNVVISLTSNKINLGEQTDQRFFSEFDDIDIAPVCLNEINAANFYRYRRRIQNAALLFGVYLKNKSQLQRIKTRLENIMTIRQPNMLKILILDDEADNCSQNTKSQNSYKRDLDNCIRNSAEGSPERRLLEFLRDNPGAAEDTIARDDQNLDDLLNNFNRDAYERIINSLGWVLTDDDRAQLLPRFDDLKDHVKTAAGYVFRSTVNRQLVDLVDWLNRQHIQTSYSAWTATPFANVLNEMPQGTPLFPEFIYSLKTPITYQGASQIFQLPDNANSIYTDVPDTQTAKDGYCQQELAPELKTAIKWFLCAAAARRYLRMNGNQFSAPFFSSMLINVNTAANVAGVHDNLALLINTYLHTSLNNENRNRFFEECREVYEAQKAKYPAFTPPEGYPEDQIMQEYPAWEQMRVELEYFADPGQVAPFAEIAPDTIRQLNEYRRVNIVKDNSRNPRARLCYPENPDDELAFIVLGGMTMSRGMTLEGLVSTYLTRTANNADTQMQFGRFFGHHVGFELLPRIWLAPGLSALYKDLARIENAMHDEIRENQNQPDEIVFLAPTISFEGRGRNRKIRMKLTVNERNAEYGNNAHAEIRNFSIPDILGNFWSVNNILTAWDEPVPRFRGNCFLWDNITNEQIQTLVQAIHLPEQAPDFAPPETIENWFVILSGPDRGIDTYTLAGRQVRFRRPVLVRIQNDTVLTAVGGNIADNKHWALPVDDENREAYFRQAGIRFALQGSTEYINRILQEFGYGNRPIFVINGVYCEENEHPALSFAYRVPNQQMIVANRGN